LNAFIRRFLCVFGLASDFPHQLLLMTAPPLALLVGEMCVGLTASAI
jgi:hypothetical protein